MIRIHNTEAVSSRKYSPGFDQHGRTLHFVFRSGSLALLLFATSSLLQGQQTRSAEIEREREDKVLHPPPEKSDRVERTLRFIDDHKILDRLSTGFHGWNLRLGGLPQGSGFALGPEYRLPSDFLGGNTFRVGAQLSTKVYEKYYASWQLPHIARDHISVDFNALTAITPRSITSGLDRIPPKTRARIIVWKTPPSTRWSALNQSSIFT